MVLTLFITPSVPKRALMASRSMPYDQLTEEEKTRAWFIDDSVLYESRHGQFQCYNPSFGTSCVFKRPLPPPFYQAICFSGEHGKSNGFCEHTLSFAVLWPWSEAILCRWNDKAFSKITDNSFCRCITCSNKGKSITRIRFYSSKVKAMSFPQRKYTQYAAMLLSGHPQDWCHFLLEAHYWPPHTAAAKARSSLGK